MPTVLRIGAFRFFFYSNENAEPEHIDIQSGEGEAKYWLIFIISCLREEPHYDFPLKLFIVKFNHWLNPVKLAWNRGYNERQLSQIERLISDNLDTLRESWTEFFGEGDDAQE